MTGERAAAVTVGFELTHESAGRVVSREAEAGGRTVIVDLFAGPGGWDEGCRLLGLADEIIGLELDADACATAVAAGFKRIQGDLRGFDPLSLPNVEGVIASPPCQTFTDAGKGEGQASLVGLTRAVSLVSEGATCAEASVACGLDADDPRSTLVLEPMRFIRLSRPRWVAFEEVKQVLPVWKGYAKILRRLGYSVWTGVLNAANYGVPQVRKRAFLMASLDGPAHPPVPTHAAEADWGLFDERLAWVTMAEALDWGPDDCRAANAKAPEPARDADRALWPLHRPATTIVRSFRPEVVSAPGYRTIGDPSRQDALGSIYVTDEQMCILQGIRTDYPFLGSPTKRRSLIGAVLPPPWAAAVLRPLVEMTSDARVQCSDHQRDTS